MAIVLPTMQKAQTTDMLEDFRDGAAVIKFTQFWGAGMARSQSQTYWLEGIPCGWTMEAFRLTWKEPPAASAGASA
jgi:hypothetical protein